LLQKEAFKEKGFKTNQCSRAQGKCTLLAVGKDCQKGLDMQGVSKKDKKTPVNTEKQTP